MSSEEQFPADHGPETHPQPPAMSLSRETRHFLIFGSVSSGKTKIILPLAVVQGTDSEVAE